MFDIARPENFDAHRRAAEAAYRYRAAPRFYSARGGAERRGSRSFALGPFEIVIRLRSAVASAGEPREAARLSTIG
ncbi:MAG: hypothetical protein KKB59_15775 [Spirochaetes bacterium]|nr:hypothetical protein [Spirochaetota bacterium]